MTAAAPLEYCPKCNGLIPPDELRCIRCGFELARQPKRESGEPSGLSKAATDNTESSQPSWGTIWAEQAKRRKSMRWGIFLAVYLAWFAFAAITLHGMFSSVVDLGLGAAVGLMPSLLITYVLNLLWSIWKTVVAYKGSMSGGLLEATIRSIRELSWTRLFAGVLTSKAFFVFAIFIGGAGFSISDIIRFESGVHGNKVRPMDTRMAVIAIIPNAASGGVRKIVQIPLDGVEQFKQENPDYSFLLPPGKGEMTGHSMYPPTEYTVTTSGSGQVMVETTFNDNDNHVLGRYEASDREIKPLYTKTHNDFLGWMVGTLFGIGVAIVLASVGYVLKWRLCRKTEGATATTKSLFGSGIRRLGRLTAIAFMCVGILLVVGLVLAAISKLGVF